MGEQFNIINNINRPNLVDYSLLQKINEVYQNKPTQIQNQIPSYFQRAGSVIYSLIIDNLFMSIIIIFLILFLGWCYVEKQRYDAIQEKYINKLYLKLLKTDKDKINNNDTEYFIKDPEPVNIQNLFDDIKKDIETNQIINNNIKEENPINPEPPLVPLSPVPLSPVPDKNKMINGIVGNSSSKYMDVGVFTKDSYMLL